MACGKMSETKVRDCTHVLCTPMMRRTETHEGTRYGTSIIVRILHVQGRVACQREKRKAVGRVTREIQYITKSLNERELHGTQCIWDIVSCKHVRGASIGKTACDQFGMAQGHRLDAYAAVQAATHRVHETAIQRERTLMRRLRWATRKRAADAAQLLPPESPALRPEICAKFAQSFFSPSEIRAECTALSLTNEHARRKQRSTPTERSDRSKLFYQG
jgi:hypothetical protein